MLTTRRPATKKQRSLVGDRCWVHLELASALLAATPTATARLRGLRRRPEDNRTGATLDVQVQPLGPGGSLQTRAFSDWAIVLVEFEAACPFRVQRANVSTIAFLHGAPGWEN